MDKRLKDCTGVVLAGGENSRMPVLKAFIEIDGEKIIERNLRLLKSLFNEVFIVTNQPQYYSYLGVPMLGDVYDIRGPMTGIFTSLLCSSNRWVFVSACDMPFINRSLITYCASKTYNCDAVVPVYGGMTEPLFAFYSKRLIDNMEKAIASGKKGLNDFLNTKRVKYISEDEIGELNLNAISFTNLNTPEDIENYLLHERNTARRKKCLDLE
jgi:molybdopterin-guanine dinucleotide biosynthesis protein A